MYIFLSISTVCNTPMKPVNGDVYSDGLTAIYSCRTGFTMEGAEKRYCGTDGSGWNETEPTCSKFPLHEYVGKTYAVTIIQKQILTN